MTSTEFFPYGPPVINGPFVEIPRSYGKLIKIRGAYQCLTCHREFWKHIDWLEHTCKKEGTHE